MRSDPARRLLLTAAAAGLPLLLAGCKGIQVLGPPPKPGADVTTLDQAIADEEQMVARYQAAAPALAGHQKATATITALLAEHQAHLAQLRARLILPPRLATASPSPSPSPSGVSGSPAQVMATLKAAERAATARLTAQLTAVPSPLAQLMASISASEAAHVFALNQAGLQ